MRGEETKKKKIRTVRSKVGIRTYIAGYMVLFLAIVMLVTWFFQVALLDLIYENVRARDLEKAAKQVETAIDGAQLHNAVYDAANDHLVSILVCRVDDDVAIKIAEENAVVGDGKNFYISPEYISHMYRKAKDAGGSFHSQFTYGGEEVEQSLMEKLFSDIPGESDSFVPAEMINMVYVHLCSDAQGTRYMLLLNTSLAPMAPMVSTLQRQFMHMFVLLFGLVLCLMLPISHYISRPIVHMNEAAKQLAAGNYHADFEIEESGYRETQELAESLNHAAQELSRADQLQKELIANISHDLRTPLTMIRAYSEAMRDIPGENSPENLQVLIDETEHLSELVNDLLDLSKIQSGVRCPVMEFFDLTGAVREVLGRYEAFTKGQGYRIKLEVDREVPVFADRSMILQVVYNLINNAINYTGDDRSVTVIQTVSEGNVRLSVCDTGEGIPAEQLPLIWDRYYKVDRVHRSARIGTGLGLSIVKGVLEVHNARYGVESKMGEGSVFWFELPISEPPETAE